MLIFTARRVVATAAAFLTVKALTSTPVRNAGRMIYAKLTRTAYIPNGYCGPLTEYDPVTGEFYEEPPFERPVPPEYYQQQGG